MMDIENAYSADEHAYVCSLLRVDDGTRKRAEGSVCEFEFAPGDRVHMDGDATLEMVVVTSALQEGGRQVYELSWLNCGNPQSLWVHGGRITKAKLVPR